VKRFAAGFLVYRFSGVKVTIFGSEFELIEEGIKGLGLF
jgi:hypothetical protein